MIVEIIIRNAYEITRHGMNEANQDMVRDITQAAFGEGLRQDYFTDPSNSGATVYLEKNGKGFAVTLDTVFGPYLDLIGVRDIGNGIGKELMNSIYSDNPCVFWRSKQERKEATSWYMGISNGHRPVSGPDNKLYNVYWRGKVNGNIEEMVGFAKTKPLNFKPRY